MYCKSLYLVGTILLLGMAAACQKPRPKPPAPGEDQCGSYQVLREIGRPFDDAARARIEAKARPNAIRVIRPGEMVTMDYRADRLNVELNPSGIIKGLRCG